MQKIIYKIKKLEVQEFRPKDSFSLIKITFTKNDKTDQIIKEFYFKDYVNIVNSLLTDIKSKDKPIIEDADDILGNIQINRIENEEEAEEKLTYFFQNLNAKYSKMKSIKKAPDYMKLYDEIKTTKIT